jgi:DNA processing protein
MDIIYEQVETRTAGQDIVVTLNAPTCLQHTDPPPEQIHIRARNANIFVDLLQRPRVAIVGSRKVSAYGQAVTRHLAQELASRGIIIVSGLALGVDAIAHRAALEAGGQTIAVLPGPVQNVYPSRHTNLAHDILHQDGVLISEYPAGMPALVHHFVARNRIVAGLANALLITEAAENSGTLHTAGFALEQGIDVLVVPGNITSPTSKGTNRLLKTGAVPVTEVSDILHALGIAEQSDLATFQRKGKNQHEQQILDLIQQGIHDGGQLLATSKLGIEQFNHHLTMLEITTKIRPLGNNQWALG